MYCFNWKSGRIAGAIIPVPVTHFGKRLGDPDANHELNVVDEATQVGAGFWGRVCAKDANETTRRATTGSSSRGARMIPPIQLWWLERET